MTSEFNNMGSGTGTKAAKGLEPLDGVSPGSKKGPDDRQGNNIDVAHASGAPGVQGGAGLEFILDVPLEIAVELGRTKMFVNDLLKLGQGSVIELSKIAGETMDIMANNKLIARGEVVVSNEKYGVRLTEVITPAERLERLR